MLFNFKKLLITGTLLFAAMLSVTGTAAAQTWMRTFTVVNGSHYRIDHLYVSPNTDPNWGADKLGQYVLLPGYQYQLTIVRGWYDVELVDRNGYKCVVRSVDFLNGDTWTITDGALLYCELFGG